MSRPESTRKTLICVKNDDENRKSDPNQHSMVSINAEFHDKSNGLRSNFVSKHQTLPCIDLGRVITIPNLIKIILFAKTLATPLGSGFKVYFCSAASAAIGV